MTMIQLMRLIFLLVGAVYSSNGFMNAAFPLSSVTKKSDSHQLNKNNIIVRMISFGGTSVDKKPQLPRDVQDAVSKCRSAVQDALKDRLSRMDIEMPVGTKFGVEKGPSKKSKKSRMVDTQDDPAAAAPTRDMLDKSDRELARLFVEMFLPVGAENIAVVFSEQTLADEAKKMWRGDPGTMSSKILSISSSKKSSRSGAGGKKKAKKKKPMGFAAKMAAEVEDVNADGTIRSGPFELPDNTEVALFVAPTPKDLIAIERVCSQAGMGTLVVLLNARLSTIQNFGTEASENLFKNEFEQVFSLCAAPQEVAPSCLLYRSYPDDWVLARKPKVGQPKSILVQKERPSADQCRKAYDDLDIGDVEKGIENMMENVAGWLT